MAKKHKREAAQQTFRQFAWNLAGTLADKQQSPPRPVAEAGRRA